MSPRDHTHNTLTFSIQYLPSRAVTFLNGKTKHKRNAVSPTLLATSVSVFH